VLTNYPERRRPHSPLHERSRRVMMQVVAGQLVFALAIAVALGLTLGGGGAYAALVGGLVGVVPNFYLALRMARSSGNAAAEMALRTIYVGELIKIAFTVAMFIIAIVLLDANFLIVVLTYIATVAVNWFAFLLADFGERPGGATGR
jgi:ATP synthase protein I